MISIVIPTYNEADNIGPLLEKIEEMVNEDYEIIIVDDSSSDGTAERARETRLENLKVIERDSKTGIGSAYKTGFPEAGGEIIVQMDADFSHPPEKIPELVEMIREGKDVAVGSRYVEQGDRNDPIHRRIPPLIGSYLYRYGLGSPVNDVTSGFKAYNREAADFVLRQDLPDGFHFQAASLMKLVEEGKSMGEIPIDFRPRRAGKPKYTHRDLVDNVLLLARLGLKKYEKMIKFGTVGFTGVFVNMGVLYFLTEHLGIYYLLSAVIAVETSILSNFGLNEVWTFVERGKKGVRNILKRLLKFNTVSIGGLALNLAVLWLLTEFAGLYYLVSNLFAIAVVFLWNYTGNVKWTWRKQ